MTIDWWTLGLQAFNFIILVWLLRIFLFRPVVAAMKARRAKIDDLLSDAETAKAEAEAVRQKVEAEVQNIEAIKQQAILDARTTAAHEKETILAEAQKQADIQLVEARKRLDDERQAAERHLLDKAGTAAVDIAAYLLRSVNNNTELNAIFLDQACKQLSALAANKRAQIIGVDDGTPIKARLVTASPISSEDASTFKKAISKALGHAVDLDTADDGALIAGLELHFPHVVIRHNWRDALSEAVQKMNLNHEDAQRHA